MNVPFISVRHGPKVPKNDQKKGLFGVKSGSKMAKNSKMNGNERKKWSERSFPFSTTERCVHCVHFRSVQMNVSFTAFISVQYKWTFRSLRSFPFSTNERKWTKRSFGFHKSPKTRKMNGNERSVQKMNGNGRNVLNGNERDAQPCQDPTLVRLIFLHCFAS